MVPWNKDERKKCGLVLPYGKEGEKKKKEMVLNIPTGWFVCFILL